MENIQKIAIMKLIKKDKKNNEIVINHIRKQNIILEQKLTELRNS